ncbi:isoleucine--tRNA ligase [Candidatus Daviesbacteria bacterium]|nr:isoleucine--tRNA ligase [Candidatus Daviesbacteria bacterium]
MTKFKPVSSQVDFVALEKELLEYWEKQKILEKYLHKNDSSEKKFSFLDGPITANNPMGVHHAWGRTYKDVWQRFFNMRGFRQRFQNGFDEQGLWVEVEVEKELGLKSKKDIENLVPGDKFASLEKFINLCKERVKKYSAIQTEQSKRLGYFMDWDNSYHTSSDENNYAIWNYLKVVHEKGWLYKGRDSVPWCPRCGTAISQHEILTEEYQEIIHESVYFKLPIRGRKNEYLLVWTTTPWTIPANVAVAVDPEKDYLKIKEGQEYFYIQKGRAKVLGFGKGERISGKNLVGLEYDAPFDHLPRVKNALGEYKHRVVENDELILPISEDEGTGLVHVATGAGSEDFKLGLKLNLPVIEVIDEGANYLDGMDSLSGQNAKLKPQLISGSFVFKIEKIKHRYPTCWRCKTELVWRVVDEWYIAMDRKPIYRQQMIEVAKKINWIPKWGLDRELDWLKNMHDWLISKKRYWGLSLPIWECHKCGNFEVIGNRRELKEKAVKGWSDFDGHSPHRPWIDQIKLKCSKCDEVIARVPDVGNPWLDAGIVPFSTMPADWFPADFITEGFPGQFKNWFYSLIAMSTALKNTNPFKNLLGFASVVDERGEEMHKSKGNAIEFNEAADKAGVDVMRWVYVTQNPEVNLPFGYNVASEVKRRFYLILWNCYKFFVDYANYSSFSTPEESLSGPPSEVLDKWVLARLNELIFLVNDKLEKYDASSASRAIEDFVVNDFSTWYIRRSRNRIDTCLPVMYEVLVTLSKLLAPFTPFIAEEIYRNLTGEESVHLQDYPQGDKSLLDEELIKDMALVRKIAESTHAKRKEAGIKLRQPLALLKYGWIKKLEDEFEKILKDEVNVKEIKFEKSQGKEPMVILNTKITQDLKEEGKARELIRMIQQKRKDQNLTKADKTTIIATSWPKKFEKEILQATTSLSIREGSELKVLKAE